MKNKRLTINKLTFGEWAFIGLVLGHHFLSIEKNKNGEREFYYPKHGAVRSLLEKNPILTEKEKSVLFKRLDIDGKGQWSRGEIAKDLNLSVERIRQYEQRALRKIRTYKHNFYKEIYRMDLINTT